jgi:hypothetical protein
LLVVNHSGAGSANEPSAPTHRYAAAMPVSMELLDPEPHRDALFTAIKKEREQLRESRRRAYDELARILNTFDTSFPDWSQAGARRDPHPAPRRRAGGRDVVVAPTISRVAVAVAVAVVVAVAVRRKAR